MIVDLPRLREFVRKELRQALREPRMRTLLFLPPLIQLLIFGYVVNLDVDRVRIAWIDQDRTPQSRDLFAAFEGSRRFVLVDTSTSNRDAESLLDSGDIDAAIRVLPGFGRDILRLHPAAVQILVDGTNSNTASIVSSYAGQVIAGFSQSLASFRRNAQAMERSAGAPVNAKIPVVDTESRVWFNPELKSRNYYVPGVVVNIMMITTMMLTALAIVREKEIGTMEQLMVTPIRPIELIIGKTVPFALVGLFDLVLVTSAALIIFRIPLRGSVLLLLGCSILFLLTTLGAGLLISTLSQTQQQAMMSSFFFVMPCFMLSGFAFPVRNMPVLVQYLTLVNPVRYFMEIVRGIFLKGVGVSILWPQMVALAVFGTVMLGFSAVRFKKRLD
jgi:drug efflux transport system permease protein